MLVLLLHKTNYRLAHNIIHRRQDRAFCRPLVVDVRPAHNVMGCTVSALPKLAYSGILVADFSIFDWPIFFFFRLYTNKTLPYYTHQGGNYYDGLL